MRSALVIVLLASGSLSAQPDVAFREALDLRHDAAAARPKLIEAAKGYDAVWQAGERTAAVAVNRGRAHALAGDLPGGVAAVLAGLADSPYDAELQHDLEALRDLVPYPVGLRPDPPGGWRYRVSSWDLFAFAAMSVALLTVGMVRRFTARDDWAIPVAVVGAVGLLAAVTVGWQLAREANWEAESPPLVLIRDTYLRAGNGESYPPRLEVKLPRGGEVRERLRRGGWVQVEAANGAVGWVQEGNVIPIV